MPNTEEHIMSTLIAVAYPDESTAQQARATLRRLQTERLVELDDAVIAINDNGKIRLDQSVNLTGGASLSGALWGGLIGLIFLMPIAGAAIGAASGAISGHFSDYGIDDQFVKDLGAKMQPGHAALFVLIRRSTPDRVLAEMKQFGGTVLRTNLSNDAERQLQAALAEKGSGPETV
jgi:uncharacterized membrane protein